MNQKACVMVVSGIVATVTSLVFTGSAMGLIGVRKTHATLDPTIAGQQPVAPKKISNATDDASDEEKTVETNL